MEPRNIDIRKETFLRLGLKSDVDIIDEDKFHLRIKDSRPYSKIRQIVTIINSSLITPKNIIIPNKKLKIESAGRGDFTDCIFEGSVEFEQNRTYNNDLIFRNCVFKNWIKIAEVKVVAKLDFYNAEFNQTLFARIEFKGDVDFRDTRHNQHSSFFNCTFSNRVDFSGATFRFPLEFWRSNLTKSSSIVFKNTTFQQGINISSSLIEGKSYWSGAKIELSLNDIMKLEFFKENQHTLGQRDPVLRCRCFRDTYLTMKQSLINELNIIEALQVRKLELEAYELELKLTEGSRNDKIILCLNRVSNKHNTSWKRGVGFTLGVWLLTTLVIFVSFIPDLRFSSDRNAISDTFVYFFRVLNITEWKMDEFKLNAGGYISLFVGRIFISYGYYQTVQAFRKYRNV